MSNYADLWLGYSEKKNNRDCKALKNIILAGSPEDDKVVINAVKELKSGLKLMLDIDPVITYGPFEERAKAKNGKEILDSEEYKISLGDDSISVEAKSGAGILYAVFDILRTIACEKDISVAYSETKIVRPSNPLRMLNHWDNMDGSIERGYSGNSFFYVNNEIVIDERTRDYARLIASVGINACGHQQCKCKAGSILHDHRQIFCKAC